LRAATSSGGSAGVRASGQALRPRCDGMLPPARVVASPASRRDRPAEVASKSSRNASRRSRSIARLRAVVMIHPAGAGGIPLSGQRATAVANASCTASSARSMSPNTRASTATARPYSRRKTRSISERVTGRHLLSVLELALERTHPRTPSAVMSASLRIMSAAMQERVVIRDTGEQVRCVSETVPADEVAAASRRPAPIASDREHVSFAGAARRGIRCSEPKARFASPHVDERQIDRFKCGSRDRCPNNRA